jgi:hypothetical protein
LAFEFHISLHAREANERCRSEARFSMLLRIDLGGHGSAQNSSIGELGTIVSE